MDDRAEVGDDPISSVHAVVPEVISDAIEPLDLAKLPTADQQLDEMLRRLHHRDQLGALILSYVADQTAPGHGLATVCRKDVLAALKEWMDAPAAVVPRENITLSPGAHRLLSMLVGAPGATIQSSVPTDPRGRIAMLCALHELVRVDVVRLSGAR